MSLDRSLNDLHPWVHAKADYFLLEASFATSRSGKVSPINMIPACSGVLVVSTSRTAEQQQVLHQEGRSNAGSGQSAHEYGLAFDIVPLDVDGKPWWEAPQGIWDALYVIADKCGLDPLGMKGGEYLPWDKGHLQEPGWKLLVRSGLVKTWSPGLYGPLTSSGPTAGGDPLG